MRRTALLSLIVAGALTVFIWSLICSLGQMPAAETYPAWVRDKIVNGHYYAVLFMLPSWRLSIDWPRLNTLFNIDVLGLMIPLYIGLFAIVRLKLRFPLWLTGWLSVPAFVVTYLLGLTVLQNNTEMADIVSSLSSVLLSALYSLALCCVYSAGEYWMARNKTARAVRPEPARAAASHPAPIQPIQTEETPFSRGVVELHSLLVDPLLDVRRVQQLQRMH